MAGPDKRNIVVAVDGTAAAIIAHDGGTAHSFDGGTGTLVLHEQWFGDGDVGATLTCGAEDCTIVSVTYGNTVVVSGGFAMHLFAHGEAYSLPRFCTLNPSRRYRLRHTSVNGDGDADTTTIRFETDLTVRPDTAEGAGRFKLASGKEIEIGPGVSGIRYSAGSAAGPVFTVEPIAHEPGEY